MGVNSTGGVDREEDTPTHRMGTPPEVHSSWDGRLGSSSGHSHTPQSTPHPPPPHPARHFGLSTTDRTGQMGPFTTNGQLSFLHASHPLPTFCCSLRLSSASQHQREGRGAAHKGGSRSGGRHRAKRGSRPSVDGLSSTRHPPSPRVSLHLSLVLPLHTHNHF